MFMVSKILDTSRGSEIVWFRGNPRVLDFSRADMQGASRVKALGA